MSDEQLLKDTCRICLEEDNIANLIYPCRCSGTSKYIHKTCLNQWRTLSDNPDAYNKCFECNYKYRFSGALLNENKPSVISKFFKFLSTNLLFFCLFNLCVIFTLSWILSNIDTNQELVKLLFDTKNVNDRNIYNAYILWSSIFYIGVLFTISFTNFLSMKNKKLYLKHYCRQKGAVVVTSLIVLVIIFAMNSLIGLFIVTISLQILIKYHFNSIENIRRENNLDILNYDSLLDTVTNDDTSNSNEAIEV